MGTKETNTADASFAALSKRYTDGIIENVKKLKFSEAMMMIEAAYATADTLFYCDQIDKSEKDSIELLLSTINSIIDDYKQFSGVGY